MDSLRSSPAVVLVGGGRLARTLLRSIPERITASVVRNRDIHEGLPVIAPGLQLADSLGSIDPTIYDTLWLVTSDSALAEVADELAAHRDSWSGMTVLHSSGSLSPSILDPFKAKGGLTFALHPNGSYTGESAIVQRTLWSLSSDDPEVRTAAASLLDRLEPRFTTISEEHRALYHAAASVAANYSVTLFAVATELFIRAGLNQTDASTVVANYMRESIERSEVMGERRALTGPIARGDEEVVRLQMEAIRRDAPEVLKLVQELAMHTSLLAGRTIELPRAGDLLP